MHIRWLIAMLSLMSVACWADDATDRKKLAGTWDLENGGGKTSWTLAKTESGVHLTYLRGSEKLADFECNTIGNECSVHMNGHAAKVSLYYNGPRLVMLETNGDTIVKWTFGLASDAGELEVEAMPITAAGKTETLRYKRAEVQASR